MFTGIIAAIGTVTDVQLKGKDAVLQIDCGKLPLDDTVLGDSIAVNGCCLTVVEMGSDWFKADVSAETLRCTTIGSLQNGSKVNLEKAMLASDRFGGHIVSGHVDGVGELVVMKADGDSLKLEFSAPAELKRYIAAKGSITIDGTSLTVNSVMDNLFTINVIPHTQQETIIGAYSVGQRVNLEVDLIARYLERLQVSEQQSQVDRDFLHEHGFMETGKH